MKLIFYICLSLFFSNCYDQAKKDLKISKSEIDTTLTQSTKIDTIKNKLLWLTNFDVKNTLINRISLPEGYFRKELKLNSFGHWIRRLPLKEGKPKVLLYNGSEKGNKNAHHAVFDIDIGTKDLQQCADATMRIRAEYLFHTKQFDQIHFNYTNGALVPYTKWRNGYYPIPKKGNVSWVKKEKCNTTYKSFKTYLIQIFNFAGTHSLSKELTKVPFTEMQIGDLLIKGGFPGHAVMVVDLIENSKGEKKYLLAQSYMPAQNFQLLKNPNSETPWYNLTNELETIETPEWTFSTSQLMRWN